MPLAGPVPNSASQGGLSTCCRQARVQRKFPGRIGRLIAEFPTLRLEHAEQLAPMPFAHPVATYEAGSVVVGWD
jgi:hypothetical protein